MAGRPSKLTPETRKRVLDAVAIGATYEDAALAAGVTYQTFLNWRHRGEREQRGEYFEFFEAMRQADAKGKVALLAEIHGAARREWRAAAWSVERRDPDHYAPTQKHRHGGDPDNPTPIETRGTFTIIIDRRQDDDDADADGDRAH